MKENMGDWISGDYRIGALSFSISNLLHEGIEPATSKLLVNGSSLFVFCLFFISNCISEYEFRLSCSGYFAQGPRQHLYSGQFTETSFKRD